MISKCVWGDAWEQQHSNLPSRLLSVYSQTACVQAGAAHREARSLSIPFIHSLIQSEGNYRPPPGSKISVSFSSHQGASWCRIPSLLHTRATQTNVCIDTLGVKHPNRQQQTSRKESSAETKRMFVL